MTMWTRRDSLRFGLGALLVAPALLRADKAPPRPLSPDQAHRELVEGNRCFVEGRSRHPHASPARVRRTSREGQHPHAVVLCCSDSRVAPEIVFDVGLGDLFVVRVAGNVANEDEIASIEYAVEHLGVPLCLVLGHTNCGAVEAVVSGEHLPVEIEHMTAPIRRVVEMVRAARPDLDQHGLIQEAVPRNTLRARETIKSSATLIAERVEKATLRVEAAVYDLETGRVGWLR